MSSDLLELLDLNDLSYIQSTEVSVATNSQQRKFYPEKTSYKENQIIRFHIHGNQFLDLKKTSLKLDISFTGGNLDLVTGQSMLNFINRVRIVAPNGKEVSDVRKANLLSYFGNKLYRNKDWEDVVGSGSCRLNTTALTPQSYPTYLPLRLLSPFFDNSQLLPPQLTENLMVEIYLETLTLAVQGPAITDYSVENPQLICQMTDVSDSVLQAIKMMGEEMMVYEYEDFVHADHYSSNNANDIRTQLPYSLSNALEVFTSVRKTSDLATKSVNSFRAIPINLHGGENEEDQLLYRVGEVKMPQQKLVGGTAIYDFLLRNRNVLDKNSVDDCYYLQGDFEYTGNGIGGIYFANLRRSKIFNTSGREISNQNSLQVEIKYYNGGVTTPVVADMFVKHVARVVVKNGMIDVER